LLRTTKVGTLIHSIIDKCQNLSGLEVTKIIEHPMNCKPIARPMTRFSIRMPFNMLSSSPERRSELRPQLVRAPRVASNFHLHNDAENRKFGYFGWKVTLCNFWGYYTSYYTFIKIHVSH